VDVRTILGRRLVGALYAGVAAYCCLSLLFGPAGFRSKAILEREIAGMRANLLSLEARNGELAAELEALATDPDRARLEARSLGWLAAGESQLVIAGKIGTVKSKPEIGEIIKLEEHPALADIDSKRLALAFALLYLAGCWWKEGSAQGRRHRPGRVQAASRA
jgi:cell division protein FtsB